MLYDSMSTSSSIWVFLALTLLFLSKIRIYHPVSFLLVSVLSFHPMALNLILFLIPTLPFYWFMALRNEQKPISLSKESFPCRFMSKCSIFTTETSAARRCQNFGIFCIQCTFEMALDVMMKSPVS